MMSTDYRARPLRGTDLVEMQRSNLRALLRQRHRELGSWVAIARLLRIRRSSVKGFFDGDEPGNMALARGIAAASELDLDVALAGHFTITVKGIKAIKGAQ
jgi:hypothetical protein